MESLYRLYQHLKSGAALPSVEQVERDIEKATGKRAHAAFYEWFTTHNKAGEKPGILDRTIRLAKVSKASKGAYFDLYYKDQEDLDSTYGGFFSRLVDEGLYDSDDNNVRDKGAHISIYISQEDLIYKAVKFLRMTDNITIEFEGDAYTYDR